LLLMLAKPEASCPAVVDEDSVQAAPFLQGLLAHSLTSTSQLPDWLLFCVASRTLHRVEYSEMKS
jgi:hypothetical protein